MQELHDPVCYNLSMNYQRILKLMLLTTIFTIVFASTFFIMPVKITSYFISHQATQDSLDNFTYREEDAGPAEKTIGEAEEVKPLSVPSSETAQEEKEKVFYLPEDKQGKGSQIIKEPLEDELAAGAQIKNVLLDAPFIVQAPFAEWSDPRQQDGCEEAAVLMAVRWARGEELTKAQAKKEILTASAYQSEQYGEYRDTSAEDTAERILYGYFGYKNYEVKKDITAIDIIKELMLGNVIIAPMDGQVLGNPFYTRPGPERHMLLINGYDADTEEFITNDNGTRKGEGYRYARDVLFDAIRDYPSGYHVPIEVSVKVMIVVRQEKHNN